MATTNVIATRSGTGFTIDVTACNLLSDLSIKDFVVLNNGSFVPNTSYTKTTSTVLTYTGASLPSTTVEIRRKTPTAVIQTVTYGQKFTSSQWNNELDRTVRWKEEVDLNGAGGGVGGNTPKDDAYPTGWSGDTVYSPTRNAAFNIISTLAPLASPTFTGTVSVPNTTQGATGSAAVNSDRVNAEAALKSNVASPAFTGTPTAPTPLPNDNTTKLATTAFVKSLIKVVAARFSSAQSITASTFTTVVFDTEQLDTDNAYNNTTGVYTVPSGQGGLYQVSVVMNFGCVGGTAPTAIICATAIAYNGTNNTRIIQANTPSNFFGASGSSVFQLNAGDTIRVNGFISPAGGSGFTNQISPVGSGADLISTLTIVKLT